MFELTNEQRKCFALPPVLDTWRKVEAKAGRYDYFTTYAFLDGQRIVKVIQVSDTNGGWLYREYEVDQTLSEDGTKILPKTEKGKPQVFTAANLLKKTHLGMELWLRVGMIDVYNNTTNQSYYHISYDSMEVYSLSEFSAWVEDWCRNTGEKELAEINAFSKRQKVHQKFREGDFFRYRIKRNLYGYGRILVDYGQMRKEGIPYWEMVMDKHLIVGVYHIATEDENVTPEQLAPLKMLPSQMMFTDIFYSGECEIIGNMPISPDEDNYTIHYGGSMDSRNLNHLYYQCGKTFAALEGEKPLYFGFQNIGFKVYLNVELPILLECIKQNSNEPYWDMVCPGDKNGNLRNPKYEKELKQIKEQMGVE